MINIVTYGSKYGDFNDFRKDFGRDFDSIIDCRALPNPYHQKNLKDLDGRDHKVSNFMARYKDVSDILDGVMEGIHEGDRLIGFMCYGGRHRSVALANLLANRLTVAEVPFKIYHRDVNKK